MDVSIPATHYVSCEGLYLPELAGCRGAVPARPIALTLSRTPLGSQLPALVDGKHNAQASCECLGRCEGLRPGGWAVLQCLASSLKLTGKRYPGLASYPQPQILLSGNAIVNCFWQLQGPGDHSPHVCHCPPRHPGDICLPNLRR